MKLNLKWMGLILLSMVLLQSCGKRSDLLPPPGYEVPTKTDTE